MSDDEDFAPDYIDEDPMLPENEDGEPETEVEDAEDRDDAEDGHSSEEETEGEPDDSDVDSENADAQEDVDAATDSEVVEAKAETRSTQSRALVPIKGQPARAEKARIDPLMQMSNTPLVVKIVHPDDCRTSNVLQKSEAAHILGKRAKQIADSPTVFVDITGLHDPGAIAYKELAERKCPLIVRRVIAVNLKANYMIVEDWDPNTMAHPQLTPPTSLSAVR